MKKIFCIILSIFFLFGCQKEPAKKIEIRGIQNIQYDELTQKLHSNVTFILYIGRPDCGDCQAFYPVLEEYINTHDGTGIYYLNIKEFRDQAKSEEATKEEKDFYDNLYKELHFDWTPTIHVISNGKFKDTYQYLDEDYFEIEDRLQQLERKQEFLDEFQEFMDNYFKEEVS